MADAPKDEKQSAPPQSGGRLSRLRFKKKDMPGGLWLKCESCTSTIYRKELEERGFVCPVSYTHLTLPTILLV